MKFSDFLKKLGDANPAWIIPEIRDLNINTELSGAYYIQKSGTGLKEYVLITDGAVPGCTEEPELYFGFEHNRLVPIIDATNPDEIHFYINSQSKIIFTTYKEDTFIRGKIPAINRRITYKIPERAKM